MLLAPMYICLLELLLNISLNALYITCGVFFILWLTIVCLQFQIRALDKITLERVSAERTECLHRIDKRATQERLEGEKRQVIFTNKCTCRYSYWHKPYFTCMRNR